MTLPEDLRHYLLMCLLANGAGGDFSHRRVSIFRVNWKQHHFRKAWEPYALFSLPSWADAWQMQVLAVDGFRGGAFLSTSLGELPLHLPTVSKEPTPQVVQQTTSCLKCRDGVPGGGGKKPDLGWEVRLCAAV